MGSQAENAPLGKEFTQSVIDSMAPSTEPRVREVMSSFIRHMHEFALEVQLTTDEWMSAVNMINWAGQMSDHKRNEGQLMCDVIGLESLIDDITHRAATNSADATTTSAILGPFWRADRPTRENGTSITSNTPKDGQVAFMHGQVLDAKTAKPVANASVDVWQASTNGLYEQQDSDQVEHNLRGKFVTDSEGRYSLYCLRPTPYPIPDDGPSGKLLGLLGRHPYRPAHIHLIVQADGYKPITTQIFDKDSKYLNDDSVFAVKDDLTIEFVPRKEDPQAEWELKYDVKLARSV